MTASTRQLVSAGLVLVGVAGFLGWWVFTQTAAPARPATPPPTTSTSPLASPVIELLRKRLIFGELPLKPVGDSDRTDPFVQ